MASGTVLAIASTFSAGAAAVGGESSPPLGSELLEHPERARAPVAANTAAKRQILLRRSWIEPNTIASTFFFGPSAPLSGVPPSGRLQPRTLTTDDPTRSAGNGTLTTLLRHHSRTAKSGVALRGCVRLRAWKPPLPPQACCSTCGSPLCSLGFSPSFSGSWCWSGRPSPSSWPPSSSGAFLLVTGISQVVLAFSLHGSTTGRILLFVSGAAAIVLAVLCFLSLQESILLLAIWIGIGFIFRGVATAMSAITDPTLPGRPGRSSSASSV